MQYRPSVSVIIPAYNAAEYLGEAIRSVWLQGVENVQLIVVNDGSTDATAELLAGPAARGAEIIHTHNQGVAAARNEGLERATGEYVAFLDADDRWRPNKLRRQLQLLQAEPDIGTVFSNFDRFDTDRRYYPDQFYFLPELELLRVRPTLGGNGYRLVEDAFSALVNCAEIPGHTQTMLFRRSAIANLRFRCPPTAEYQFQFLEDMDFCLRAFRQAPVAYINDPLTEVRRHRHNLTYDYRRLAVVKLDTLRAFENEPLKRHERRALRRRIGRQCVAAGSYYLQVQQPGEAMKAFALGLRYGRYPGATKGLLKAGSHRLRGLQLRTTAVATAPGTGEAPTDDRQR